MCYLLIHQQNKDRMTEGQQTEKKGWVDFQSLMLEIHAKRHGCQKVIDKYKALEKHKEKETAEFEKAVAMEAWLMFFEEWCNHVMLTDEEVYDIFSKEIKTANNIESQG